MATYADWEMYEPPAIKRALPVEFVLEHLFGVMGAGDGDMLHCPLPGHEDDTASFNLWAPNKDGVPTRFGCFGCGENGDVIDLIRLARGCSFADACTAAVEELIPKMTEEEWVAGVQAVPEDIADPDLEVALIRIQNDTPALHRFVGGKYAETEHPFELVTYHLFQWDVRASGRNVVFPHRDWDHNLTAIRFREAESGDRWTARGSRFGALYGAWREKGYPAVVLCEGETDTIWAAWQMEGRPVDVMGLPSGAAQKPPEESLERLQMRTVWLAFDGDMAGRIATTRWTEALENTGATVRIVPVPDGEDLVSCGVPVEELLRSAT